MDEVVVVNEDDEVVGTMPIDDAHRDGTPHQIAVVYVVNDKGEILIQVRTDGYFDHSAAGHVDPGESYEEAAARELSEELGINEVILEYVGHGRTRNEKYGTKVVSHVFDIFKCTAKPGDLQRSEVKGVYWAKPSVVLEDMEDTPSKYCGGFIESLKIYLEHS